MVVLGGVAVSDERGNPVGLSIWVLAVQCSVQGLGLRVAGGEGEGLGSRVYPVTVKVNVEVR